VLGLKVNLKIDRIWCFSRNRFKVSPKSVVQAKIILDINSQNPLYCFFFLVWMWPFGVASKLESPFHMLNFVVRARIVEESFLAGSKIVLTTDYLCCIRCSDLNLRYLSEWFGLR